MRLTTLAIPFRTGMMFALLLSPVLRSSAQQPRQVALSWNARVLQRILAEAPPGPLVPVGDMVLPRLYVEAALWQATAVGTPASARGSAEPDSTFAGTLTLWPAGMVIYDFAKDVKAVHQQAFVDAARDWTTFAHVTFARRTVEPDYVLVQNLASGGGVSAVGKVGGPQTYMIGPSAWNRGTLCHELGHTFGLVHEHQRSDRDSYVTILTQNLVNGPDGNFVKLTDSNNQGAYDFDSVMHYAKNAFAIDPTTQDTIEPLAPYAQYLNTMGNNFDRVLSTLDRQKMAVKYGTGPTQSSVVTNTRDSGPGSLRAAIYYAIDHPATTITFAIPTTDSGFANNVYTVLPSDVLTRLGTGTVIDGTTQTNANPRGPAVNLSGAFAQAESFFISGLKLTESNCTMRGLGLSGFTTFGVEITARGQRETPSRVAISAPIQPAQASSRTPRRAWHSPPEPLAT